MAIPSIPFNSKDYLVEHLFDSEINRELIELFEVGQNAKGLERYLKHCAVSDEVDNMSRTYLVKDRGTLELAAYFSLRSGLITPQVQGDVFESISALELSNFAVNKKYRELHPQVGAIGSHVFFKFIIPLVQWISKYLGVNSLYIYSLPEESLISHYRTMGFTRLPPDQEMFIHSHVKPKYDEGCIFMYQVIGGMNYENT